jgi:hypothetical protein
MGGQAMKYVLRTLIFLHRWVGIALCLVFLLWFPSGIGMMYWGFPDVSASDRLDHSPKLDPAKIVISPTEAAERVGVQANPTQIRLNSFDGRPVYRFGGGGRGGRDRGGVGGLIVYADTGDVQTEVSSGMLDRIASSWAEMPLAGATKESVEEPDQWTVAGQLRNLRPMYKYSWSDGQQVYLNGITGEVVQYTTFRKRLAAHVSAIPHWLYYTPLRKYQPQWLAFMIWSSLIGTIGAIIGIIVAIWMYSPRLKYRLDGKPTGIPYRGQKRWHWILGMIFGLATVTWTFSGLMSLGPFPLVERLTQTGPRPGQRGLQEQQDSQEQVAQASQSQQAPAEARGGGKQNGGEHGETQIVGNSESSERRRGFGPGGRGRRTGDGRASSGNTRAGEVSAGNRNSGGRTGTVAPGTTVALNRAGQRGIAAALRGRVTMADFESMPPGKLLTRVPNLDVKELEWTSFPGTPLFSANLVGGKSQPLSMEGEPINGFDRQAIFDIIRSAVPDPATIETRVLDQYDLYYFDRTRQRPLPVILVLMNDADKTRYYIDPKSARVATTYSNRNWVNRWLYTGLHSLNFPFLYNHRPLWDIVVIAFMIGGTALCVTSLVLAWRVLGRKLKRIGEPANDLLVAR